MKLRNPFTANRGDAVKGALFTVALGWFFFAFPVGQSFKNLSYELPFLFRVNLKPDEVAILYMNDDSHVKLGQDWNRRWDRALHVQLLERLTAWGAKAVVFDLLFDEPDEPATDAEFIRAVKQHGKVIVSTKVVPHIIEGNVIGMKLMPLFDNVLQWGAAEVSGEDKTIRQHYRDTACQAPSLAWTTAQLTMTDPPADRSRARWVNYYGPPGILANYSYYEVLSNSIPAAALSNKVVFVGVLYSTGFTGGVGTDDFRTPYTRWTGTKSPGVEINATTYLNLRKGDWLTETPLAAEWALLALCGAALGYGLTLCRPRAAVGVGLAVFLGVALVSMIVVWGTRIWFPWLLVTGVQIPGALAWSVLVHTKKLGREKEALEKKLATQRAAGTAPYVAGSPARPFAMPQPAELYPATLPTLVNASSPGGGAPGGVVPEVADHTLLRCVGQGAYGRVWLARDAIGTFHAVKVIYRHTFKELGPFEREFRGIQKFTPISRSHPGFVNILHVGRNDEAGYFYYIMELGDDEVSGQQIDPQNYSPKSLGREMHKRGRLPAEECLQLSVALASALDYLHQHQLIHRDIKPANIIFVNNLPKFADIGLVTDIAETGATVTYLGTQGYIAPEGPGTPAADVYSLGKVMYEASTGLDRARFPDLPTAMVESADSKVVFQLNKIILRACETDARKRYQSAADLQAELVHLQRHRSLAHKSWFRKWS